MQRTGCTRLDRGTRVPDDRVHCRTASQAFQITRYTAGRPHSVPDNWVHCRTAPQAFQITGCTLPDGLTSVPENWASPGKQWPQDSLFLLMEGGQQGWGSRLWDLRKLADKDTQSPWLLLFSLLLAGPVLPKHMAAFTGRVKQNKDSDEYRFRGSKAFLLHPRKDISKPPLPPR